MTLTAMKYVWANSQSKGAARLVMLAIGDMATETGDAFPGVDRLAELSNVTDRGAQNAIQELERMGELQVFMNVGTQTQSGWTNLYRIVMKEVRQNEVRNYKGEVVQPRPTVEKKVSAFPKAVNLTSPLEYDELDSEDDFEESEGVNSTSPHEMNLTSPNPPVSVKDSNAKDTSYLSTAALVDGDPDSNSKPDEKETIGLKPTVTPEPNLHQTPFRQIIPLFPDEGEIEVVSEVGKQAKVKKERKPRQADVNRDALAKAFKIAPTCYGHLGNLAGLIFGSDKIKGAWKDSQLEPAATIDEVKCFGGYAEKRAKDNGITIPTVPATVQRWFEDFRLEKKNDAKIEEVAAILRQPYTIIPIGKQRFGNHESETSSVAKGAAS